MTAVARSDLAAALAAEQAHTARLTERVDDLTRQIATARTLVDDVRIRVAGWVADQSLTDHHAHADVAGDLVGALAVLERAELIGRQA